MGTFRKGDIVLFPFPYTNLKQRKLRPCLVLSDEIQDDIILCQITSQEIRKDKFSLSLSKADTIGGSLKINSYIRCNMLFTAHKEQVLKKLSCLSDKDYAAVVNTIVEILAK